MVDHLLNLSLSLTYEDQTADEKYEVHNEEQVLPVLHTGEVGHASSQSPHRVPTSSSNIQEISIFTPHPQWK